MSPFTLLKHHSGKGWVDVTVWALFFFFSDSLSSFSFRATTLAAGRGFEKGGLCWAAALKNLCSANSTEFMSKGINNFILYFVQLTENFFQNFLFHSINV